MPNLKKIALVMSQDYDRGLHRRFTEDGHEALFTEVVSSSIDDDIRHVHWDVESLRWDLKQAQVEQSWINPPHVQMWLV